MNVGGKHFQITRSFLLNSNSPVLSRIIDEDSFLPGATRDKSGVLFLERGQKQFTSHHTCARAHVSVTRSAHSFDRRPKTDPLVHAYTPLADSELFTVIISLLRDPELLNKYREAANSELIRECEYFGLDRLALELKDDYNVFMLPQEDQMIRELERKLLGQLNAGITLMKTTTNKSRM